MEAKKDNFKTKAKSVVSLYGAREYFIASKPSNYNIPVALKGGEVLLFNSCSRALIKLEEHEYQALTNETIDLKNTFSRQQVHALFSDQFVVPSNKNEINVLEANYNQIRKRTTALNLTIAPTFDCNLACGYCFQGLDKGKQKISEPVETEILKHLERQKDQLKSLSVTWYGGEPLMAKPGLLRLSDKIISFCEVNGIQYSASIVTNGYLLNKKTAEELLVRKVAWAQITIDGMPETHDSMRPKVNGQGSFERIIENIKEVLNQTSLIINVRVNVGNENISQCEELLNYFHQEMPIHTGRLKVYFAPIDASTPESGSAFEQSLDKRTFNQMLRKITQYGQSLGIINVTSAPSSILGVCVAIQHNGLVIAANGDLHKCWETMHDSSKKIGTIFDVNKAIDSYENNLWDNWSPYDNDTCRSCKVLPICGGMCGHRFVYSDQNDENSTPCPDWKWNTAENIFSRALQKNIVKEDDWLPNQATIDTEVSGKKHTKQSLTEAQNKLENKLTALGITKSLVIPVKQVG